MHSGSDMVRLLTRLGVCLFVDTTARVRVPFAMLRLPQAVFDERNALGHGNTIPRPSNPAARREDASMSPLAQLQPMQQNAP